MSKTVLEFCRDMSARLDKIGQHTVEGGMNTLAYSDAETESMRIVAEAARNLGAEVYQDQAGNISAVVKGTNPKLKTLMSGSHLDAVPQGGQYDGRAGVLVQLGILKKMKDEGSRFAHDTVLQIWRAEESPRFGKALIGSALATGLLLPKDFNRASLLEEDTSTLEQAMKAQGLPVDALLKKIEANEPLLPLDMIGMAMEMHIEQADFIRKQKKDLGIVTGIRGNMRTYISLTGEAGHTGGAPQYSFNNNGVLCDARKEASRGIAKLIVEFEEKCAKIAYQRRDIVMSVPEMNTPKSSSTKICDLAGARLEVRSTDITVLEEMKKWVLENAADIASSRQLGFVEDQQPMNVSKPLPEMSEKVISLLEEAGNVQGYQVCRLPSGAGHDTMNLGFVDVPCSMVLISHNGLSHRPEENMVLNEGDDPYGINSPFDMALQTMFHAQAHVKMCEKAPGDVDVSYAQALMARGAVKYAFAA